MVPVDTDSKESTRIEVTDGALLPNRGKRQVIDSWRLTFVLAIVTIAGLVFLSSQPDYAKILRVVIKGIPVTFGVTLFAILGSIFLGLFTGLGQISRLRFVNLIAGVYVELIRGIPLLVQIMFIYFALGKLFQLEGMVAAVIALSICYGAYMGEIFRAGIQSVHKGQMEAAMALGLTRGQAMRMVILPQAMRIILPAIGNEFIAMLKDSSLVSVIALRDILRRGREYVARTFESLPTYALVALVYLVFTLVLSKMVAMLEDRMKRHER